MPVRVAFLVVGLGIALLLLGGILFWNRGAHMELRGQIQKVRTLDTGDGGSVVVIDFRLENPADFPFVVRTVEVTADSRQGEKYESFVVADRDAARMLAAYPLLGPKYNDSLLMREKIPPRTTVDRMLAARFQVPESALRERARLRIRIEEVDGAVSFIDEQPPR